MRIIFVLLIAAFATSCISPEEVPLASEILPAGFTEHRIPDDLIDDMSLGGRDGMAWVKCVDCKMTWTEFNSALTTNLGELGWKDTTSKWFNALDMSSLPEEVREDFMSCYSSASGNVHIFVMNIKMIRDLGAPVGTMGDFVLMTGYDNIRAYQ